jgi:H+/Cl- antiporter ClcA
MITAAFACFAAGTLLGTRFRVAVLVPAMLVTMAAVLSFGILNGQEVSLIVASQLAALTALQLGYISSAIIATRSARKLYQRDAMTLRNSP